MSLHDTDGYAIEATGAAESLPNANTVAGRTHVLLNASNAAQTWTGPGAVALVLVIPTGESREVYSNGTNWIALPAATATVKSFRGTGVSDGAGNVVFNYAAAGFAAPPVVTIGATAVGTNVAEQRITAISATSCTVNCRQIAGINVALLGLTLLGLPSASAGVTVHIHAFEAGVQA